MSNVITLTNENFEQEVIESSLPVLVDFWAPWCSPCKMMSPVLEDLSSDFDGKLVVAKLDVDNSLNQGLAAKYRIQSIPALKLFKNGQIVNEYVGYRDKNSFSQELIQALK